MIVLRKPRLEQCMQQNVHLRREVAGFASENLGSPTMPRCGLGPALHFDQPAFPKSALQGVKYVRPIVVGVLMSLPPKGPLVPLQHEVA